MATKTTRVECPVCGGDGWVDDQRDHAMRDNESTECRACDGRGYTIEEER